jgi:hypothetical protein
MNLDQLKKSVGYHVNLHPIAVRLDERGNELEMIDDDWAIRDVSATGVRIENISTGHTKVLGPDHIHHYTSNPDRKAPGVTYGFLTLMVQLFLQGHQVLVRPTARPGERVTLDGRSMEEHAARATLLDRRLDAVMQDFQLRGTPQPRIEAFGDLSQEEKADLYDKAVRLKHGREPRSNPFRP